MRQVTVARQARFTDDTMQKVVLFESAHFFCDLYCLAPGQAQRVHAHAGSDKVYYVQTGRATIQVGAEEAEVGAGVAVLAPAGCPHGVANRTGAPVTVLVFMAPKPDHG
jgi:mannose-6-phosphate isomerase-like protein (cupin superfamily)